MRQSKRWDYRFGLSVIGLVLGVLTVLTPALAVPGNGKLVPGLYNQLLNKANQQGSAAVIVQLEADDEIDQANQTVNPRIPDHVLARRQAIEQRQSALLAKLNNQNISRIKELESMIDSYSMMVERNTREIKREKEQVEKLLLNVMPRSAYDEYKTFGTVTPRTYDKVAVLCLDFSDFTQKVAEQDASVIVSELNDIYTAFDRIGDQFGCERIKTVGDLYIAVAGMPDPSDRAINAVSDAAVRFVRYLQNRNASHPVQWACRIGLSSGSVIGSVVGVQKYIYDVFGPAVADAMRLREEAGAMDIIASAAFADGFGAAHETIGAGNSVMSDGRSVDLVRLVAENVKMGR